MLWSRLADSSVSEGSLLVGAVGFHKSCMVYNCGWRGEQLVHIGISVYWKYLCVAIAGGPTVLLVTCGRTTRTTADDWHVVDHFTAVALC